MPLDFNSDIAPLRSQFFPVGGLRQSEFQQLQAIEAQTIAPLREQSMKMANNILNLQQQNLAYERSQLALESARRRSKMEVDAMGQLPALTESLDAILNDKSKDSFEQTKEISRLQMGMASALPFSPAMQNIFAAAANTVQADANKQRKAEEAERRSLGILHTLGQVGALDAIQKRTTDPASAGGIEVTSEERAYEDLASEMKGRSETKTLWNQQELQRTEFKAQADNQRKRLLQHEATLLKMGAVDDDYIAQSLKTGVVQEPKATGKIEFKPEERESLEEIILSLNPNLDPEFVKNSSTKDLFRASLRTINQSVRRLNESTAAAGKTATGASTIGSNFD
jgi:hypothetical protein